MLRPYSFVLFRSPLQSFNKAYTFFENTSQLFDEGIFLSSPELWSEWQKLQNLSVKEKNKLLLTLYKYWLRSCTRCTPFATLAGCFVADIAGDATKLILNDTSMHKQCSRLDMNFLSALCKALASLPVIKNQLTYSINNSLYELPSSYRYAEYSIEKNMRRYVLTEIEKTTYLKDVFAIAKNECRLEDVKKALLKDEDVDEDEAQIFIDELCEAQVLINSLEPQITGDDPFKSLIQQLSSFHDIETIVQSLKTVYETLRKSYKNINDYQQIEKQLISLPLQIDISKNTVQTDLFLSAKNNTINKQLVETIVAQASDLMLLSRRNTNSNIEDFKKRFLKKYEAAEVPLAEALDADFGIGYANVQDELTGATELINDLDIKPADESNTIKSDYITNFVLKKYAEYKDAQSACITVTGTELKAFAIETKHFEFGPGMYLIGNLFSENNVLDPHNFLFDLSGFGSPSSANLLARFAHGDENLSSLVKEILATEEQENKDAIYAEIVHLPEAKIGNILQRPVLRKYEIPYTGKSGALQENQIFLDDILVCVKNNSVILRSKKFNKQIIPRLTSAHNYTYKSLPVYKFLCDLQMQNFAQSNVWDWAGLDTLKFLPRVVYKNIILKKARWKINEVDLKSLPENEGAQKNFIINMRQELQLPKRVAIAEGDNELMIDFDEAAGIELFIQLLKKLKEIIVEEYLFTENNCIIKDDTGAVYTNELIVPLVNTKEKNQAPVKFTEANNSIKRKFIPFSEWQYYKLYCGPKTAEKILRETISNFIQSELKNGLFDKFFFIRFKDDFSHLRIRFFNENITKQPVLHKAFIACLQPFINDNIISSVTIDTYARELERYGHLFIEQAETIFFNDSVAVLQYLQLVDVNEENYRLYFAMKGVDFYLNEFNLDLNSKHETLKILQRDFFTEFGAGAGLQKQLNEKYRRHQQNIFNYLGDNIENEVMKQATFILRERSSKNIQQIKSMRQTSIKNMFGDVQTLPKHFIHMFINRLFISSQRKHELLIYHFLEKYYASQLAIAKEKRV